MPVRRQADPHPRRRPKRVDVVASQSHRTPETDAFIARYEVGRLVSAGSSLKFCLSPRARRISIRAWGTTMQWDTAAGDAVLRAAGGMVVTLDGKPLALRPERHARRRRLAESVVRRRRRRSNPIARLIEAPRQSRSDNPAASRQTAPVAAGKRAKSCLSGAADCGYLRPPGLPGILRQKRLPMTAETLPHLRRLEAEAIFIMREVVANFEQPVMLYSIGKDSSVMLHLALKAFYPAPPPFPLLHVDTTWKFREMIRFRDETARKLGLDLHRPHQPGGRRARHQSRSTTARRIYTQVMKTEALKQALDAGRFDAAFGGARRDEEKSRAKERIFSFRSASHGWDPKNQRPELWSLYNTRVKPGESIRVFPLSNWTELDIWQYILAENIDIVPLYFAAERPVVERDGQLIMVDDERMRLLPGEVPEMRRVRFRTLGCYPLTAAIESDADDACTRSSPRCSSPAPPSARAGSSTTTSPARWRRRSARAISDGRIVPVDRARPSRPSSAEHEDKSLLRFLTCGSVDDGKSTLIGRLLYDTKRLFEDQLADARDRIRRKHGTDGDDIDFALLVDGLEAEREQGITIDVAYRYFATDRRHFIVADTPGHEQYTRNMATGASTADLAVLLVDARKGILTQTRRHAYIVSLLGIRHVVLAVNKIDLVDFDEARFDEIVADFAAFAEPLRLREPSSRSRSRPATATMSSRRSDRHALVSRPDAARAPRDRRCRATSARPSRSACRCSGSTGPTSTFRGYAGTIAAGTVRPGDDDRRRAHRAERPRSPASSPWTATSPRPAPATP